MSSRLFAEAVFAEILVPGLCVQKRQARSIRHATERGPRGALAGFSKCLGTPTDTVRTKCKQGGIKAGAILAKRVPVRGSRTLPASSWLLCSVFQCRNFTFFHASWTKDVQHHLHGSFFSHDEWSTERGRWTPQIFLRPPKTQKQNSEDIFPVLRSVLVR